MTTPRDPYEGGETEPWPGPRLHIRGAPSPSPLWGERGSIPSTSEERGRCLASTAARVSDHLLQPPPPSPPLWAWESWSLYPSYSKRGETPTCRHWPTAALCCQHWLSPALGPWRRKQGLPWPPGDKDDNSLCLTIPNPYQCLGDTG